ncbi:diacylglycerol kinase [Vibrio sp. JC009]|uniref:diacylglycerol kinase n=1 Tax=Vibrio sp. JC009 TaxID=2912314 RepID=UPI0023B04654|nr:diacylglycerol kinase [Vibrio sp. JC009]WED21741.1 diacylglycerol kinase [Vibrio sp. JC009]
MKNPENKGIKRLINATIYSSQGIKAAFTNEEAFRQEVFAALIMLPLAFYLDVDSTHRIMMVASVLLVMIVELLNTAVEAVVDRVGFEFHELAGRAKDTGSAAVLISMVLSAYVWCEAIYMAYFAA